MLATPNSTNPTSPKAPTDARLHPLAVEDALRSSNSPRSKLDFYRNHLYLQILVHHVHAPDREALARAAAGLSVMEDECLETPEEEPVVKPRWWRPTPKGSIRLPEGVDAVFEPTMVKKKRVSGNVSPGSGMREPGCIAACKIMSPEWMWGKVARTHRME